LKHSQNLDMASLMSALLFRAVFEVNDTCNRNLLVDTREMVEEGKKRAEEDGDEGEETKCGGERKKKEKKVYSIDEMGVFSGFRKGKLFSSQPDSSFMRFVKR